MGGVGGGRGPPLAPRAASLSVVLKRARVSGSRALLAAAPREGAHTPHPPDCGIGVSGTHGAPPQNSHPGSCLGGLG